MGKGQWVTLYFPPSQSDTEIIQSIASYLARSSSLEEDSLITTVLQCAMVVTNADGAGLTLFDST